MNDERTIEWTRVSRADPPAFCAEMRVMLLKSGSLCEFVEYLHGSRCTIRRLDTGKSMTATLAGIRPVD